MLEKAKLYVIIGKFKTEKKWAVNQRGVVYNDVSAASYDFEFLKRQKSIIDYKLCELVEVPPKKAP